jgi:hypothetical protein
MPIVVVGRPASERASASRMGDDEDWGVASRRRRRGDLKGLCGSRSCLRSRLLPIHGPRSTPSCLESCPAGNQRTRGGSTLHVPRVNSLQMVPHGLVRSHWSGNRSSQDISPLPIPREPRVRWGESPNRDGPRGTSAQQRHPIHPVSHIPLGTANRYLRSCKWRSAPSLSVA